MKTLGLLLTGDPGFLSQACRYAASLGAHLIGVHVADPLYSAVAFPAYGTLGATWLSDAQRYEQDEMKRTYRMALEAEAVSGEFRGCGDGEAPIEFLLDGLRGCDLVIAAGHAQGSEGRFLEAAIRSLGRPVLVLPQELHILAQARSLLIGISPTRESTRAAHDALALAEPGAEIALVAIIEAAQPGKPQFDLRQDLAAAFDRLGHAVTLIDRSPSGLLPGEVLLQAAEEIGADLVATGAFGHSRLHDFVLGAVTTHLLRHAKVPVLMSK